MAPPLSVFFSVGLHKRVSKSRTPRGVNHVSFYQINFQDKISIAATCFLSTDEAKLFFDVPWQIMMIT